jgi:hypothetical protein
MHRPSLVNRDRKPLNRETISLLTQIGAFVEKIRLQLAEDIHL